MTHDEVCDVLNDLIATCKDGENGFLACAERLEAPELRTLFMTRAEECKRAADDLQALVEAYGGKPASFGTPGAALHRRWIGVRGVLNENPDLAMLEECERGEDSAVRRYREALQSDLPPAVREVVEYQWSGVQGNHELIRGLRDRRALQVA
jgi:uncharacterized protein (TIGR02284 family)